MTHVLRVAEHEVRRNWHANDTARQLESPRTGCNKPYSDTARSVHCWRLRGLQVHCARPTAAPSHKDPADGKAKGLITRDALQYKRKRWRLL